jgi:hypothetical protein
MYLKWDKRIRRMGKAQRAHQSQGVLMGTSYRPLPILPYSILVPKVVTSLK